MSAATTSLLLIGFLSGCINETNYKTLSFFFDGVPNPSKIAAKGKKPQNGEALNGAASEKQASQHGPYAAKQCNSCHNRGTNALVRPVEELCLTCHDIKLNKKWIHGPLVSGGCRVCHLPHTSPYRYLLVSDSKDFCFYCHSRSDIARNPAHEGAELHCTSCHEPHMSDKEYLLR